MRSYWDGDLTLISAENVEFSVETAGLGSRMAAVSIDLAIQLIVLVLISLVLAGFEWLFEISSWLSAFWMSALQAIGVLASFLLFFGYYFFFEWAWGGQTPGKRLLGLRVMMADGRPLDAWAALARNVARVLDSMPPLYGIGALVSLSNPFNQRAGDLIAGTIVMREGTAANRPGAQAPNRRAAASIRVAALAFLREGARAQDHPGTHEPSLEELAGLSPNAHSNARSSLDADSLRLSSNFSRQDYELARDFLERRDEMASAPRQRLGQSLAARLRQNLDTVSLHEMDWPDPNEEFLQTLVTRLQPILSAE